MRSFSIIKNIQKVRDVEMITYKNKNKRMNREQEALFSQESFHIDKKQKWSLQKFEDTISLIKIWNTKNFCFYGITNILNIIEEVAFPRLQKIIIWCEAVENVEPLVRIYLPSLQILSLSGNKITKISSIGKCFWPQLGSLYLQSNPINDFQGITKLHCPMMKSMNVQCSTIHDPRLFSKISALDIFSIRWRDEEEDENMVIPQDGWESCMERKYCSIDFDPYF